ncbi:2-(hydroxymethyl)glutarate dehydrogenase [archaeon HR01]|nr:2-(hydroxymethyl)glutarate dehydrogenase [archaeon HR01]
MAENLLRNYPLVVWNRSREKVAELVGKGAVEASTPAELAARSEVIVSMLATPEVTADVMLGRGQYSGIGVLDGVNRGGLVIDMSTNSPQTVELLASMFEGKGCGFVDAPVMGSVQAAAEATLTILASGKLGDFEKARPVLEKMGKKVWYLGDVGKASSLKIIFNLHLWLLTASFSEAFALAEKAGLDPAKTLEIWNSSNQKTYISETKGPKILANDWKAAFTVELAIKDLKLLTEMAERLGFQPLLGNVVYQLYQACSSLGYGGEDFASIIKVYRFYNMR